MRSNNRPRVRGEVAKSAATEPRPSLYDEVTTRIVAELEAGRFPWVQPWGSTGTAAPGLPRNAVTSRTYSGVNILLLWAACIAHGHASQSWLTFRQAVAAGGCVRKGERGVTVVYADRFIPKGEAERAAREDEDARAVPFLKRFTVFNVAQCEGLQPGLACDPAPLPERKIVPIAEALIAATGVDLRVGGDKAYYAPSADYVAVPPQVAFFDQINYYRTCLHECAHATGASHRLDRSFNERWTRHALAMEEATAELTASFILADLGLAHEPRPDHAAYIASWLQLLKDEPRAIFTAASKAQVAADWMHTRQP
ncbi:MAG: antirepressor [Novosphingobium sp. SCN 66-18]|mgnify:CR=1 FL=1|nr:MAG: antirepressor [Novosphingobium sp. SCN 66-18]